MFTPFLFDVNNRFDWMDFAAGLAKEAIVSSLYWFNKLRFVCDRTMYDDDGATAGIFWIGPVRVISLVATSKCRFLARFPVLMPKLLKIKWNSINGIWCQDFKHRPIAKLCLQCKFNDGELLQRPHPYWVCNVSN